MTENVEYNKAYLRAVEVITDIYNQCQFEQEEVVRETLFKQYKEKHLDPDGKALRYAHGVKCAADGLHSMR